MMRMRYVVGLAVVLGAVFAISTGCTRRQQYTINGGDRAPGADARVDITAQDGGNFLVEIAVSNLLPPARLSDGLTEYAVWFQGGNQQPTRVGTLTYDEDERSGSMTATTTHTSFQLIISGEAGADAVSPSDFSVFRTTIEAP